MYKRCFSIILQDGNSTFKSIMWFIILLVAFRWVDVACTSTGRLRLVDGSSSHEGRLEIYYDGVWGTVCDDHFDCAAAMVVCRELGYRTGFSLANSVKNGISNGKIWLDDIECTGAESSLTKCQHSLWGTHNCNHNEDVGVHCFGSYENSYDLSGNWGTWTIWTSCSATCAGGLQSRSRICNNRSPPAYCQGTQEQSHICNNVCYHSPINGGWSIWTEWTTCTTTCGGGLQHRSRDCNNPLPSDGGTCCDGISFENRLCDSACCTDRS